MDSSMDYNFKTFIIKGLSIDSNQEISFNGKILTLKHPKTNGATKFYLADNKLYELLSFQSGSSYFIDDIIQSKGDFVMCSQIDPIFIVLPYLMKSNEYLSLEDVLKDSKYPNLSEISICDGLKYLKFATDEQDNKFRYNEKKVLRWLDKKYAQLVSSQQKKFATDETHFKKMANGIVLQYLNSQLSDLFLDNHTNGQKRKSSPGQVSSFFKKQKLE